MPGTLWSAPSSQQSSVSVTTSSVTTATLTDVSPQPCLILPGQLNLGTRIRLSAAGSYTATTTASTLKWGFYMQQVGSTFATTPAILAETAATAAAVATAWPIQLYWSGVVQALSVSQNATTAKVTGQGWSNVLPTSLTAWGGPVPFPLTAPLRTVVQTATGLNTETPQYVAVGLTVATNTGWSSVTIDELTCELIG
jgi:hypothetical protein